MQGVISEEKVDSFNVPLIYLSVKAVKEILRRCDECFSIEWMEILEFKNIVSLPTVLITIFLALLEDGIQVLVYAGEEDLICNWLGNSRWVHAMEWSGQKEFGAASTVPFFVDGAAAGTLKSHGPLAFLKVNEAGHMIPMDQPKAALQMLTNWMQGKLTPKKSGANVSPK
ncbi:hypothetical protein Ahy_B07g086949 [Arachis hypogaea]|uniref:Serine carboxypeptidase-like n=1 Tax=Arachis hypogaea TaxID=3818 RepID=A0A444YAW2_ARAHY|nr:hypothetical protein Ahy_B07g086949 [Arachis hypogaea]